MSSVRANIVCNHFGSTFKLLGRGNLELEGIIGEKANDFIDLNDCSSQAFSSFFVYFSYPFVLR